MNIDRNIMKKLRMPQLCGMSIQMTSVHPPQWGFFEKFTPHLFNDAELGMSQDYDCANWSCLSFTLESVCW